MSKRMLNLLLLVSLFLTAAPYSAAQAAPATGRHSSEPIPAFMVEIQENERLDSLAWPAGATNESASQPTAATGAFAERGIESLGQLGGLATAVAIQGNYAYVGVGARLVILDLFTPNNPVAVGETGLLPNIVADVFVAGAYAFVADAWAGLRIIEVADPTAPHEVGYYDTPYSAQGVFVAGGYAYVADSGAGLRIIDIADPTAPQEVGSHFTPDDAVAIFVTGNYAYVAIGQAGLRIVDIANPTTPFEVGSYDTPGDAVDVFVSGAAAFVADNASGLRILDVSDPAAARELGSYDTSGYAKASTVVGTRAYVIDSLAGLYVLDISHPEVPVEIGRHEPRSSAADVFVAGDYAYLASAEGMLTIDISLPAQPWEAGIFDRAYPAMGIHVAGDYAYVAASAGLRILDVSNPSSLRQVGFVYAQGPGYVPRARVTADSVFAATDYVYVAGSMGLQIVDISNPADPHQVGFLTTPSKALQVIVVSGYAYLADSDSGLLIVDVTDPANPRQVGALDTPGSAQGVYVSSGYAYVADARSGLRIIDVANPATPRETGFLSTSAYARQVNVAGRYAYVATCGGGLRIVDVANPQAPSEVGTYQTAGSCFVSVFVLGSYAYVGNGSLPFGVSVIDVTDPAAPQAVSFHGTAGGGYRLFVANSSEDATAQSAYVADGSGGLEILRFRPPVLETVPPAGGQVYSESDRTAYEFSAGTFPEQATVVHERRSADSIPLIADLTGIGHSFLTTAVLESSGQPVTPSRPFTITIVYAERELKAAIADTLALYAWDGAGWRKEPTSRVDVVSHTIVATPERFALWAVLGDCHRGYLPLVSQRSPASVDLTLVGMEITQAVQNPDNDVPLVAERPTILRVYGQTTDRQSTNGVYLTLTAARGGQPLPGSPLTRGPWAVFPIPGREKLSNSFNIALPLAWLTGDVLLTATIHADSTFQEANLNNNASSILASFQPVPPLSLKLVPISYTHTPTGKYFPAPTADLVSEWLMRSYPIHALIVSFHTPVIFKGDLSRDEEWGRLLNVVTAVKQADGAPAAQVYYGLIPITNPAGDWYPPKWGGLGWLPGRAAIGLDGAGSTLAHEVGHNFGLPHAPCGDVGGPDPNYPYSGASIGQYGLDVFRMRVWSPVSPDYAKDTMSYCGPKWFSDYNYRKLYDDQRAHGALTVATQVPSLLIRGVLDAVGGASLQPIYSLPVTPSEPPLSSDYSVELLDSEGGLLLSQAVSLSYAEEEGIVSRAIYANVALPDERVATVRLLKAGTPVAERLLRSFAAAAAAPSISQTPHELILSWSAPGVPALVRYTTDDGQSWTTLGLDVLDNELRLDPETLASSTGRFEITFADANAVTPFRGLFYGGSTIRPEPAD